MGFQPPQHGNKTTKDMILIILILILILKALTDALFFKVKKRLSKWVEELWFIVLVLYLYNHNRQSESEVFAFLVCYYFMRAAIFDTLFNLFAVLPIFHTGTTSSWDDYMAKIKTWQYITLKSFLILIALLVYFKQLA